MRGYFYAQLSCWFSLNNSEIVEAANLSFSSNKQLFLETFMANLSSLIFFNLEILNKTKTGVFSIDRFLVKLFINKNWHNSRINNDIDMTLESATKPDMRNTTKLKKIKMTSSQQVIMSLLFFQFLTNSEQSGIWIPNALSIILKFLTVTNFCLT